MSADTPPTFLWHTATDDAVPFENSFLFANAILKNKGSLEMHIYPNGGHGLALGTEETKSILFGHSMGASTTFEYVRNYGVSRLKSVSIFDMTPKLVNDGEWNLGLYHGKYKREDVH